MMHSIVKHETDTNKSVVIWESTMYPRLKAVSKDRKQHFETCFGDQTTGEDTNVYHLRRTNRFHNKKATKGYRAAFPREQLHELRQHRAQFQVSLRYSHTIQMAGRENENNLQILILIKCSGSVMQVKVNTSLSNGNYNANVKGTY